MDEKKINSVKVLKILLIAYLVIFIAGGVVAAIFGVSLDINFKGGTRISYAYSGKLKADDVADVAKDVLDAKFTVSENKSIAGDTKTVTISLVGKKSLSADTQEKLTTSLQEKFKDNKIELYDSNSVSPSVAGTFFAKSLVAVLITAALVVVYVGIRFRKIGGVSAALTSLCALVFDLVITFVICVIFRLQIDSNYIAVVLTILGYSLNDTIVVYDRVRENKKLFPQLSVRENMDLSIKGIITRNIVTSVTTVIAVLTIVVVAEIYGLTSLRTFAIPMAFGLASGCLTSLFIAGPLWVLWREYREKKKPAKKA